MGNYKYCPKCGEIVATFFNEKVCSLCNVDLIETDIECDLAEYCTHKEDITQQIYDKYKIKENPLYDEDLAQKQKEQYKKAGKATFRIPHHSNANKVTCPYCKSTNVEKIGTIKRSVSVGLFGLASKKIGKQWHCNNCKSDF